MESAFNRISTTPERLREAMNATGKKQVDLVRATGIDKGSISNYLSGRYEPKQEAIYKLAIALNVSEMWLWGYDVPAERQEEPAKKEKKNDAIADIVVKLRTDEKFLQAVMKIYNFDSDKLDSFLNLID
jgi:transcriptional regulator with XRE-family HTH domain